MKRRLRIGFIPIAGSEEPSAPVEQFAAEVGRALGVPADSHRAADYRGLVAALEQGTVQIGWVPPLIAARSVLARRILPVAITVRNGTTSYLAALITHRDSSIRTPQDLRLARAAWVDRESASGYGAIRMALRALGVSLVDAFGEEVFARSHAEVARLVASRAVDVGATYFSYVPDRSRIARAGWMRVDGVPADIMRIVLEAGPIPSDFFAVHASMPADLVEAFQGSLLDGRRTALVEHAKALLRADGFVRSTTEHLGMLEKLVATLDLPRPTPSLVPKAGLGR